MFALQSDIGWNHKYRGQMANQSNQIKYVIALSLTTTENPKSGANCVKAERSAWYPVLSTDNKNNPYCLVGGLTPESPQCPKWKAQKQRIIFFQNEFITFTTAAWTVTILSCWLVYLFICCFTSCSTARVILRRVVYGWRKPVHTAL